MSNYSKVPVTKRIENSTSKDTSFHGRFSVLSALMTPLKLKIYNFSHQHYYESIDHNGSIIEIIIPVNCFIMFHGALIHCGTPSWYIDKEIYHTNTISCFSIVEQDYNIDSEIIDSILSSQFCCVEEYSICKNHKFGTKINVCIIIDLTNQK